MLDNLATTFLITGRVRDLDNIPVENLSIEAFDKDLLPIRPDRRLGEARSGADGSFEITFSYESNDPLKEFPKIYLIVRDKDGKPVLSLIRSEPKDNPTGRVDFEIKTTALLPDPKSPNPYANSANRLASNFSALLNSDTVDLSLDRSQDMWSIVFGAINSWVVNGDQTREEFAGYDGLQVPELPRQKKHDHIIRWDEAVLPE